jgi:hypothetical protein
MLAGLLIPDELTDEQYTTTIRNLRPDANEFDILPPVENNPPIHMSLQLDANEVRETVYRLHLNSSAGNTGWTPYLLSKILHDRKDIGYTSAAATPPHDLFVALTAFYNKLLRGEYSGICRDLIIRKFVVLIQKADGTKARPIGLLDCVLRIMDKCSVAKALMSLGNKLESLQFGIGKPRGAQLSVKHSQLASSNGDSILVGGCRNTFNEMRLLPIFIGLLKYCPEIIRMASELSIAIENHKGEIIGYSSTGSTQGCPWGFFNFCVGFQNVLIDIENKCRQIETEFYAQNPETLQMNSFVKATAEDVIINSHSKVIAILASELPAI